MQTEVQIGSRSRPNARNEDLKCWQAGENPLCLRIVLSDETQFVLPYGYFESAKYLCEGNEETLHLQFKSHHFTIKGNLLSELLGAFQTLSVAWLKKCPRRYQALAEKRQGVIATIEHFSDEKKQI